MNKTSEKKEIKQTERRENKEVSRIRERLELNKYLKEEREENIKRNKERAEKRESENEEWKNQVSRIEEQRNTQYSIESKPICEKYDSRIQEIEETFLKDKEIIEHFIDQYEKDNEVLAKELESLGFFEVSKKNEIKKTIRSNEESIDVKRGELNTRETDFLIQKNDIVDEKNKELAKIKEKISEMYPIPLSPEEEMLSGLSPEQRENYFLKKEMLEVLRKYGESIPTEIMERCGFESRGISYQRQNALLRSMVAEGILSRRDNNHKAYFSILE